MSVALKKAGDRSLSKPNEERALPKGKAELVQIGANRKAELKSFSKADEVRTFPKGKVELVTIGGATVGRATLESGWKWFNFCSFPLLR